MGIVRTGDWDKVRQILRDAPKKLENACKRATLQEGHFLRSKMVEGFREQAPGGEEWPPPSPLTLAMRRSRGFKGTKAMIVRGDLRNSIGVVQQGESVFVGVLRSARGRDEDELMNVAAIHENGAGPYVIRLTPQMRAFLMASLREGGLELTQPEASAAPAPAFLIVRIPARPFVSPIWNKWGTPPEQVAERFMRRLAILMDGDLGKALGTPPPTR